MHVPPKDVDAVILTHSHLDHSGAIPIFYINDKMPLYTNKLNLELTQLLVQDFIHLSGYYLPFEYLELKTMMKNNHHLDFGQEETVGDMKLKLFNAGHTPGSAAFYWKLKANDFCTRAILTWKKANFCRRIHGLR